MTEYISRDAAYPLAKKICDTFYDDKHSAIEMPYLILDWIDDIPAADVRPVVFCRDCKWCHAGYCEKYDDLIPFGCANKPWEDWFCADGIKREES